jgi:hypothetical protein
MWPLADDPVVDEAFGDIAARQLRLDMGRGNWEPARDFLTKVEDPDDLAFYVQAASYVEGVDDWIDDWIAAEPQASLPVLIRGAHAVHTQQLEFAESCLAEVTERDPDDPTPWMYLVLTGRARQVGIAETGRRFRQAIARHPWHRMAHEHMLLQLCPKWGGTFTEMHGFAAQALADMPAGNPLGALTAVAHLEHWLEIPDGRETAYIRKPDVVAELRAAADRSVWHPEYTLQPGWPTPHNLFAMAFWLAGDWQSAGQQFDIIGDLVTEWPWAYLGDAGRRFAVARDESYRRLRSGTPLPGR